MGCGTSTPQQPVDAAREQELERELERERDAAHDKARQLELERNAAREQEKTAAQLLGGYAAEREEARAQIRRLEEERDAARGDARQLERERDVARAKEQTATSLMENQLVKLEEGARRRKKRLDEATEAMYEADSDDYDDDDPADETKEAKAARLGEDPPPPLPLINGAVCGLTAWVFVRSDEATKKGWEYIASDRFQRDHKKLLPENVSRFTAKEMEMNWDAQVRLTSRASVVCCHFTTISCAEMIIAPLSLGFRASDVGQGGGGFSVVYKKDACPLTELRWDQYQGGEFRRKTGEELWGEKAELVMPGKQDADKLDVCFLIAVPEACACGSFPIITDAWFF
eukprot:COSAG01_NODE_5588_length_4161_cov_133.480059_2_plen_344_part_00